MNPAPASQSLPTEVQSEPSILDALLTTSKPSVTALSGPVVGDCINDRHPILLGRYLILWSNADGSETERWLAALHGLTLRKHDRVLLVQPANWPEPIIQGVVDGFANRPEAVVTEAARIPMKADEVIRIESERGVGLIEVRQSASGPVVRFLSDDVKLDIPGELNISARSLNFQAKLGGVDITATDDVTIKGEQVKLN